MSHPSNQSDNDRQRGAETMLAEKQNHLPANVTHETENPYVGPRSFTQEDKHLFFGRNCEARYLLSLVVSERLILFYSPSGAGKSSLINTCLIPGLEEKGFEVLPLGRVGGNIDLETVTNKPVSNIYIYNLIRSLEQRGEDPTCFAQMTLYDFLSDLGYNGEQFFYQHAGKFPDNFIANLPEVKGVSEDIHDPEPLQRVLIVDQFEEILTTNLQAWKQRGDFFDQLRKILEIPYLRVLLVMREDYVAALDPYAHRLPNGLRARYYMSKMETQAAFEAVQKPAARAGRPFVPDVAEQLVNNMRRLNIASVMSQDEANTEDGINRNIIDGATVEKSHFGQFVEPVQLQVVCYQLWENLEGHPGDQITQTDLERLTEGNELARFVNQALSDFYEQAIFTVINSPQTTVTERELRNWFSQKLITEAGTRGFVYRGETHTEGLPNLAVELLEEHFLIRREVKAGGEWYELIHDRFIEPIQEANRKHQGTLILDAEVWRDSGKDPGHLYNSHKLDEVASQFESHPEHFSNLEQEFIGAAINARHKRRARLRRLTVVGSGLLSAILIALTIFALWNARAANLERDRAEDAKAQTEAKSQELALANTELTTTNAELADANREIEKKERFVRADQLGAKALIVGDLRPQYALLLAQEGLGIHLHNQEPHSIVAEQSLRDLLAITSGTALRRHQQEVQAAAFSPDRSMIATAGKDDKIYLWSTADLDQEPIALAEHGQDVDVVAFSPNGHWLATGGDDTWAVLWNVGDPSDEQVPLHSSITLYGPKKGFNDLIFSSDNKWLAAATEDETVFLWSLANPTIDRFVLTGHGKEVHHLSFSPDSRWLATASDDDTVRLWLVEDPLNTTIVLTGHEDDLNDLAFSSDGQWLATTNDDATVRL